MIRAYIVRKCHQFGRRLRWAPQNPCKVDERQLRAYAEQLRKDLEKAEAEYWIPDIEEAEDSGTDKYPSNEEMEPTRSDEATMNDGEDHENVQEAVRGPTREEKEVKEEGDDEEESVQDNEEADNGSVRE